MISQNTMPGVTFTVCPNLQDVKNNGGGRAIAVHDGEDTYLGFVVSTRVMNGHVTLFYQRWIGGTNDAGVPLFCLFPPMATWEGSYESHFVSDSVTFALDSRRTGWPKVRFLNQICGPRPGGRSLADGLQNDVDGGTQCSRAGPDQMLPFSRLPSDFKPIASIPGASMDLFCNSEIKLKASPLSPIKH
jgi:hypothetical protein